VSNVLGLLAFVVYVALIIGVAAGVTWIVVRFTPPQKKSGGGPARS
jgi:H+/Cl- antiporter ClcA